MNFLEIKGLKKSFGRGESHIDVLKGIDMTINKGEFCVLLGPSGSGKSTLLNIIGGIDSLDEGELIINKHHLKTMKEKELRDIIKEMHCLFVVIEECKLM